MRSFALGGATLLLLGLSIPAVRAQEPPPPPPPPPTQEQAAPAAEEPTLSCGDCHELAAAFKSNPHATRIESGAVPNSVCESCHGSGAAHIEAGGDTSLIIKPVGRSGADRCLACHDRAEGTRSFHAGMHANSATVNCLSCHSVHGSDLHAGHLLVNEQAKLCGSCHSTQAAGFRNKPYAHRLGRGGLECSSCHEPHGRPGEMVKRTDAGEIVCLSCHSDKRGPFVFQHGGRALGECTTCHQLHGSSNPRQLTRTNVYQLCLECHSRIGSPTNIGSQPPSFHNTASPRYQNCTTCHLAIHGSNRSTHLLK